MAHEKREINISTGTLLKVVLVILILWFLWAIKDVLVLLLIAVTLASALEPLADSLNQKHIPRAVSVLSVYIFAIAFVGFIGYLVIPQVVDQFQQLRENRADLVFKLEQNLSTVNVFHYNLADAISNNLDTIAAKAKGITGDFYQRTLGVFSGLIDAVTILVISFYLVAERNGMKNFVITLVPGDYQQKTIAVINKVQRKIGMWLIGQFIISAIIFMISLLGLTLLHVKFALVLAILAGFFELIPYIGPFISAIPAIIFAFVQNPPLALAVALLYLFIQKTEGYILVPKIMQRTVGVSPLVIMLAILIGFEVGGILGVLLAVPIVAAVNVVIQEWRTDNVAHQY